MARSLPNEQSRQVGQDDRGGWWCKIRGGIIAEVRGWSTEHEAVAVAEAEYERLRREFVTEGDDFGTPEVLRKLGGALYLYHKELTHAGGQRTGAEWAALHPMQQDHWTRLAQHLLGRLEIVAPSPPLRGDEGGFGRVV